jgi:phosphatidylserine decarboxylase
MAAKPPSNRERPPGIVRYRDRASGAICEEVVFGAATLRFLYHHPLGRRLALPLMRRPLFSHLYGGLQRLARSRRTIPEFAASLGVDVSEAERPLESYGSLDDFFTRRLRPGARPIDADPGHLVAPCDGRLLVWPLAQDARLAVKRTSIGLGELLGDATFAARFAGGTAFVIRLAPVDYHRFHFPDDGWADAPTPLPGDLHSVHPIALEGNAPSLRNQRVVTRLLTRGFGPIAMVEVGALTIGTIVQTFRPGEIRRGDEKGTFRFGGSTVVLLVEPGRLEPDEDLVAASAAGLETLVRMGTRIGRRPPSAGPLADAAEPPAGGRAAPGSP